MNYSFQLNGLVGPKVYLGGLVTDYQHIGTLDFSRFSSSELPPLNEDALDESLGLSGSASETRLSSLGTIFWCPDQLARKVGPLTGASVNWDCLPTFSTTVRVDVNKDRDYTTLHSSDEWGNLAFAGGGVGTATGVPETEGTLPDGELSAEELDSQGPAVTRDITIDIKPGPGPNDVNLRSNGTIPVALLSDESFDPLTDVDRSSIRFGATGYDTRALRCAGERVNADRILDLVCHFRVSELGFTAFSKAGLLRAVSPSLKQIVFGAEVIRPIP
jgi:hypothetical protein